MWSVMCVATEDIEHYEVKSNLITDWKNLKVIRGKLELNLRFEALEQFEILKMFLMRVAEMSKMCYTLLQLSI